MKKKALVTAICFLLAVGEAQSAENKKGNAYYVGASIGHQNINAEVSQRQVGSEWNRFDFSNDGINYSVFAGCKRYKNKWFYGVEAEYLDGSTKIDLVSDFWKVEEKQGVSASLRGGYDLASGTFLTGRLGWVRREYEVEDKLSSRVFPFRKDEYIDGLVIGLGIEHFIASSVSILADYRYTKYTDDLSYTHFRPTAYDTKFEPTAATFTLGLAVEF